MRSGPWTLLLVILFVVALVLGRPLLAIFVAILALATGATALWGRYCLVGLTYMRELGTSYLNFGDETTLSLTIENAKALPLAWLLVRDAFPHGIELLTGELAQGQSEDKDLATLLSLKWYERVRRTHRIRGTRRGRYAFGPAELASGDMFGYQRRFNIIPGVDELVVYPRVVPVESLGLPTARPMGEWMARRQVITDPLRFAMVREYIPGDNPRHIHWRATARTSTLQVKQFDPSETLTLMLAVDVQTMARTYEYVPENLEFVITAAASLALYALDERHMVGLCANALTEEAETWTRVRPSQHGQQAPLLLSTLAVLEPFRGMPLDRMLYTVMPELPFGATVIAVTAWPTEATYEALFALQDAGYRALLLTIGEQAPRVPESISTFHLGGQDVWEHLETLELA